MKVILVCRMGSSRLPGKTLLPFGKTTLLSHIISRIELGGIRRNDICIATSNSSLDIPITSAAVELGCNFYRGSSDNVTRRILAAADTDTDFILVLGDNPWIDPQQLSELVKCSRSHDLDYAVTATKELPKFSWPQSFYPIGTRLQYIRTNFMSQRLDVLDSADVREHTSKLFSSLPQESSSMTLTPNDGWAADAIKMLNVSINTESDYLLALSVLDEVGPNASTAMVTHAYMSRLDNY